MIILLSCQIKPVGSERGSAMVLVLIMVTAITLVCMLMMAGTALQVKWIRKNIRQIQAVYTAEAAAAKTAWALSQRGISPDSFTDRIERLMLFGKDSAAVSVSGWGGFLQMTCTGVHQREKASIRVLLGERPPEDFQNAVICGDSRYPLVVYGKNRIIGDVVVGMEGVKTGWVNSRGFEGGILVDGKTIKTKDPRMPYFNNAFFDAAVKKYNNWLLYPAGESTVQTKGNLDSGTLNRFRGKRLIFDGNLIINDLGADTAAPGPIVIQCSGNMEIRGNSCMGKRIEFIAGGKIRIQDRADLYDVILYAHDGIDVSGQCRIEGQLLTEGEISVRDQVVLSYPSVLYCRVEKIDQTFNGQILIEDQATIYGSIILNTDENAKKFGRDSTLVRLSPGSTVTGMVYCKHYVWAGGTIFGTAAAGAFYVYDSPTQCINYLRDAVIDRTRLPERFLMPLFFSERPEYGILKWEEVKM